ncbi:DUF5133 domain-containing protein [Streptomyces sp. NPDC093261]|uniref:DUF5133 domain-containing protein n=1 Tax=Streptomyces sp. NPDC093261 TaxID=3366037 RepID=UPI0038305797
MLKPARAEVARHLERYRAWERLMLASPDNRAVRGNFESTGYTLCVLMGKRCAREAVDAAELYLNPRQQRALGAPRDPYGPRDPRERHDPREPRDPRERTAPGSCPAPSANA